MNKTTSSLIGLAAVIVLFVSINVVSGAMLRTARVDLTENRLYTLDQGTRNILKDLEAPILVRFYYSKGLERQLPGGAARIRDYAQRVRELLEAYEARSGGKLELRVIDPEPFSEEEDRAVAAGLQGLPVNAAGELFYLGLVASNDVGDEEVIPFLAPDREVFLEYDLTKAIHSLGSPQRPRVGVLSTLPISGAPESPFQPEPQEPWFIVETLSQLFDVETLPKSSSELPDDLDVLVLIHPRELSQELLFAIDQFVLRGGRLVAFLDPYCEAQHVPADPNNPLSAAVADRSSDLGPLLAAWGVAMDKEKIVADRPNSLRVGHPRTGQPVEYVAWLRVSDELMTEEDPITADLRLLQVPTAGALRPLEGASSTFTPLVVTSEDSMLIDRMSIAFGPDVDGLLSGYLSDGQGYTIVARVSGEVDTAFPGGPPGEAANDDDSGEGDGEDGGFIRRSRGPVNLLLVSDADLLADRWWVRLMRLGNQRLAVPQANNGDLLVNAVENLSGSADLISLRSRGRYQRPFDRIAELRRQAEDRHRAEEQRLRARLEETERAISELQAQREGGVSAIILTPEQRAEIERFRLEQDETRKKLREVQLQLRKDIDQLTLRMRVLNVIGIPSLVALAGIVALAYRQLRRS